MTTSGGELLLLGTPLMFWCWSVGSQGTRAEPIADRAWDAMCTDCQLQAVSAAEALGLADESDNLPEFGDAIVRHVADLVVRSGTHPQPLRVCAEAFDGYEED